MCFLVGGSAAFAQSSTQSFTQTVNKAPTITELLTPSGTALPGQNVSLKALVDTGLGATSTGIIAPTQAVTFNDNGTSLGTGTVTAASATNLLPYSEAFSKWTAQAGSEANPTIADASVAGPNGVATSASAITFPDTSTRGFYSGLEYTVATGNYAAQQLTFSIWADSTTITTLSLTIADGSGRNALAPITIPVATAFVRFATTVTMPAGANAGFTVTISDTGNPAGTVNLFGAQLEQASSAGVYVRTTGASETGSGGVATLSAPLAVGTQSITASYAGDTNYLASASGAASIAVSKATVASFAITSSANPANYGTNITFTATVTGDGTPLSGGTVTFLDGATSFGTCTLTSGSCTVKDALLPAGTDQISATYTGDPNYNNATSNTIAQVIDAVGVNIAVSSSTNPSTYGDEVTLTITVTGAGATPTGNVTVTDGTTTLGGGPLTLNSSGVATLTINTLTAGSHDLTVTYGGDVNYR